MASTARPLSSFSRAMSGDYDSNIFQMLGAMASSFFAFVWISWRGYPSKQVGAMTIRRRNFELGVALFFLFDYILIVGNRWRIIGVPALLEGLWVCSLGLPLSSLGLVLRKPELCAAALASILSGHVIWAFDTFLMLRYHLITQPAQSATSAPSSREIGHRGDHTLGIASYENADGSVTLLSVWCECHHLFFIPASLLILKHFVAHPRGLETNEDGKERSSNDQKADYSTTVAAVAALEAAGEASLVVEASTGGALNSAAAAEAVQARDSVAAGASRLLAALQTPPSPPSPPPPSSPCSLTAAHDGQQTTPPTRSWLGLGTPSGVRLFGLKELALGALWVGFASSLTALVVPRPCVPVTLARPGGTGELYRSCFVNNVNMVNQWWGLESVAFLHRLDPAKGNQVFFVYWLWANLWYAVFNTALWAVGNLLWGSVSAARNKFLGMPLVFISKDKDHLPNGATAQDFGKTKRE